MSEKLRDIQLQAGAIFAGESNIPTSFGNEGEGYAAARAGVAVNHSASNILKIRGADRLRFLHNQTTNDFKGLQPGQGCETVFVTSTARTIDLVKAYVTEDSVLLLVSPQRGQQLLELMERYIFPMDKVELEDISAANVVFSLIGPKSDRLLEKVGVTAMRGEGNHTLVKIKDMPVRIGVGNGLGMAGYNVIVSKAQSGAIWQEITQAGGIPIGVSLLEKLRIQQGRPAPDYELTEDYNPLEAGLWQTISFNKGCYIGQETIARLNTYKGVKQRLWGVKLSSAVEVGSTVTVDGSKVGILTSYTETETEKLGLAYIKTKAGGAGLKVEIGEASGELVNVPFLSHEYYQP
ncbi:MAG: folate-binding protein YgfZ [Gomphosphaeria aponina SAG 52.96 = DSM 107014]|uniref:Folate-binding protein YgfZ n=1 Tax=Gomphosphaeria aponina SAG 52.96 = DSM 107014 TaxID=1521640 RepID=A0A941GXA5_9CHRO|nr:folate-binding protein YgfZ [Gomphosphaeria aponina SAG 52.96 = DSM 107014]